MFIQHNKGHEGAVAPIIFNDTNCCYKGTIWKTKTEQLHYKVLHYHNKYDVEVQCLEIGNIMHVRLSSLRSRSIKNPYFRGKYGGFYGEGPYTKAEFPRVYSVWKGLLARVSPIGQAENPRNRKYIGTTLCEEWYNFQLFADWYVNYSNLLNPKYYKSYCIDKDVLTFNTPIKHYSPETCCIIPDKINLAYEGLYRERAVEGHLPMGVHESHPECNKGKSYIINLSMYGEHYYAKTYKTPEEAFADYKRLKEGYIRELAEFYYKENAILENVYNAMMNVVIHPFRPY